MGSSKKQTVGYWYRPVIDLVMCQGEIDALLRVRGGDVDAWQGEMTESGSLRINAPEIWGGEDGEGGMDGEADVMFGSADQQPNAYAQTAIGEDPSGHRGVARFLWKGGRYGAMNPYPKPISVMLRRILKGWNEGGCWYPEKAQVKPADIVIVPATSDGWEYVQIPYHPDPGYSNLAPPPDGWSDGAMPFGDSWVWPGQPAPNTLWQQGTIMWARKTVEVPAGVVAFARIRAENGCVLFVNGVDRGGVNRDNEQIPAGDHVDFQLLPGIHEVMVKGFDEYPTLGDTYLSLEVIGVGVGAMNPAHMIYDSLTDPRMQGEPVELINDASFRAAADRLFDEGFGLCTTFDPDQETVEAFRQRICDVIGAQCSRSTVDGMWYLDLIRGDYDIDELPVLTDDNILEFEDAPVVLDDMVNQVAVKWFDPLTKQERITAPVHSLGAIQAMGNIVAETIDRTEIPVESLADRVAAQRLLNKSTPLWRKTIKTDRTPWSWRIGTQFRLQAPKHGVADMVCMVGEIDKGTLRSGAISIVAVQDVFSMPDSSYVVGQPVVPPADRTPVPAVDQRIFEAPFVELAGTLPASELAALSPDSGFLQVVGARPASGNTYQLQVAPDGGEYESAGNFDWCPTALVVEAADYLDTEFTLASSSLLDRVAVGSAALWGGEIVRVDAIDAEANTVTLARGCADTVPAQHAAGQRIWFYDAWSSSDSVEYDTGEAVSAKVLTRTGTSMLPVDSAVDLPIEFFGRQARPYPPANVQINGEYYPEEVSGEIEVTFNHRDRLLQSDQLIDTTVESIGPEPGTTYSVEYYTEGGSTPIDSEVGITGASSTPWVAPGDGRYRIEVFSERDGLESWQRFRHVIVTGVELWTPGMLGAPAELWFDDDSSIVAVDDRVSQWNDRSANAWHAEMSTPSGQPQVIENALNGRRVLRADGNDALVFPTAAAGLYRNVTSGWVFGVIKKNGADAIPRSRRVFTFSVAGTPARFGIYWDDASAGAQNKIVLGGRRTDRDSYYSVVASEESSDEWKMVLGAINYVDRTITLYIDGRIDAHRAGAFASAGATSDTDSTERSMFGNPTLGAAWNGDTAAILAGAELPDVSETDRMFGYYAHRYGLTSSLPDDHPFKRFPPYVSTPVLQPDFDESPAVIGFSASTESGAVGVSVGPAVTSEFGTLLNSEPSLSAGEGIAVTSDGDNITVRLDGLEPTANPAQAVVMDHKGGSIATIALTDQAGYFAGSAAGSLTDGGVYYVRIEQE